MKNTQTKIPQTDPTNLYRYRDGIYAVDLITAAIVEFDFFTWLSANPSSNAEICEHFGFHTRPVDVMLSLFMANGWVVHSENKYQITQTAIEHLVSGTPWYIEPYFASLKDRPICQDFIRVMKSDRPANWSGTEDQGDWHDAMEKDDFAKYFTAAMDSRGVAMGAELAKQVGQRVSLTAEQRLLDIGGGSGVYASSMLDAFPELSATVLEKPPVDQVTREYLTQRNHLEKISIHLSDMFEDPLPAGFDIHLFSNVLHDWDIPDVKRLLASSAESIVEGGTLIVHEAFLNEDKTGPLPVAEYSTILMHSTQGRCYGTAEMRGFIEEAGFKDVQHFHTIADRSAFIAKR